MQLTARFEEALLLSARLHTGQVRKISGTPYLGHLLGVCAIVLEHGGDEDEAIAALLHDAVEDQGGQSTREEIRRRFGQQVIEIVDGCSDTTVSPKPPWRERKEAHVREMAGASRSVRLVMAADKLDNARALAREYRRRGESLWSHFRGGREGTLWYYRAMLEALRESSRSELIEELHRAVAEIERLAGAS